MIPLKIVLIYVFLLFSFSFSIANAQPQLIARVEPISIAVNDTLTLTLTLINGTANSSGRNAPDLTPLQNLFSVLGQYVSESTQVVNDQMVRQITWAYELSPQQVGELTIPALTVNTDTGPIQSQPVTVSILTAAQAQANTEYWLEVEVSNESPYLYEPVYYTLRFYHRNQLHDLQARPPSENVLVEPLPDSNRSLQKKVNGQMMVVSEVTYLLTPLRSGTWALPSAEIVGQKIENRNNRLGGSFFSFSTPRPVVVRSDPITMQVQAAQQQPWLPAQQVQLSERWETDITTAVPVGVPIIRNITLTVDGGGTQPLPELTDVLPVQTTDQLRVRTPSPETEWRLLPDGRTGRNQIKQSFSLTPLQTGQLTLPAMRIPWWDLTNNQLAWASLPAQTLTVVPNPSLVQAAATATLTDTKAAATVTIINVAFSAWQYGLLMLACIALLVALGRSWQQRRGQVVRSTDSTLHHLLQQHAPLLALRQQFAATDQLKTVRQSLQQYLQQRYQLPAHYSLGYVANQFAADYEGGELLLQQVKQLEQALYGGSSSELALDEWKTTVLNTLAELRPRKQQAQHLEETTLSPLNPA